MKVKMNRYGSLFLWVLAIVTWTSCAKLNTITDEAPKRRPNILWLTCEDISPTLSMYGDSTAQTPHLDKLASQSTVFNHAFAPVGVCAPSRSCIITGMYPTSIGTMHMRVGKDVQMWGKRVYDQPSNAVDVNGDTVPHYSTVVPSEVKCFTEYLRQAGYYCTNNGKTDYQFATPVTAWDANGVKAHWKNRKEGQPFFAVFNHPVTHESRMWKNKDLPLTVDPMEVPLPSYYPEHTVVRQDVARNYSNIEILDRQIGAKLAELDSAGLLENTIVFFFSDHGGPLPRGKREHYDTGLKVPFMVRLPESMIGEFENDLVSFVDLAPTVLSLAGIDIPDYMQGQAFLGASKAATPRKHIFGSGDRFDEFTDRVRVVRDSQFLYVRNYLPQIPAYKPIDYRKNINMTNVLEQMNAAGELNAAQSYWFRNEKTEEEFYDCKADPENLINLIGESRYLDQIIALRQTMDAWLADVGDLGAIPEWQHYNNMWPNGNQPITANPVIDVDDQNIALTCETEGASIAYLISDRNFDPDFDAGWQLYHEPITISAGKTLYAQAHRIGYQESEVVKGNKMKETGAMTN